MHRNIITNIDISMANTRPAVALDAGWHPGDDSGARSGRKALAARSGGRGGLPAEHHLPTYIHSPLMHTATSSMERERMHICRVS